MGTVNSSEVKQSMVLYSGGKIKKVIGDLIIDTPKTPNVAENPHGGKDNKPNIERLKKE